ncbi:hypothetical protein GOV05_04575 [Candidatus Woesearchaeota archaeon]|nr:hypothetical protein [Candidatus Woesearchaeota archaeon]
MGFVEVLRTLEAQGISDVLLPFILIFTIVFATLQKTKILGDGKKNYNVVVSLVFGLGVVIPHVLGTYPRGADIVDIINQILPEVSLALVAIIMVLLMIGVWGANVEIAGTSIGGWVAFFSFLFIFVLFGTAIGWFTLPGWLSWAVDPETQSLIIVILVFGLIIWYITKEETKGSTNGFFKRFGENLGGMLKDK